MMGVIVDEWPLEMNDKHLSLGTDRTLMSILEEEIKCRELTRYNEKICDKS